MALPMRKIGPVVYGCIVFGLCACSHAALYVDVSWSRPAKLGSYSLSIAYYKHALFFWPGMLCLAWGALELARRKPWWLAALVLIPLLVIAGWLTTTCLSVQDWFNRSPLAKQIEFASIDSFFQQLDWHAEATSACAIDADRIDKQRLIDTWNLMDEGPRSSYIISYFFPDRVVPDELDTYSKNGFTLCDDPRHGVVYIWYCRENLP